ncbi:MAG: hypothetical protein GY794_23630 [bacterium]|nr:hypothetical protein [bacterium]
MGQILLWIELFAASCLLVTVATVADARTTRPWLRWLITVIEVLTPLACWVGVTSMAIWMHMVAGVGSSAMPWFLGTLTVMFIVVATIILYRGTKGRRAATWPAWKLHMIFGATCVLSLITFWNLDLNAQNQISRLRARSASIIIATFPPRIPDGQNAALVYEQAFKSLGMMTEGNIIEWAGPVCIWLDLPQGEQSTTHPSYAKVRKILKTNAQGLNQLRRAAAMKQCCFVSYWNSENLANTLLTQISSVRTASELLAADARVRAGGGDLAGAIADLNALFAISEHVTREPTVLTALTAIAIERRVVETIEIVLAAGDATASELLALKIDPLFSHGRMVGSALRGEEALGLSVFASLDNPENCEIPSRYAPEIMMPLYRVFLMNDDVRGYKRAVRHWQRLAAKPYHQARDEWETLRERLKTQKVGYITTMMLPAVSGYPKFAADGDARHRLARLAVASTLYRVKTGDLPETLNKLTPDFIEMIPIDPFDGKPLRMARDKNGGVILYSVGPDIKDDGGQALGNGKTTGDITFRLAPKK